MRRERRPEDLVERRVRAGAPECGQPSPRDEREPDVGERLNREEDQRDPRHDSEEGFEGSAHSAARSAASWRCMPASGLAAVLMRVRGSISPTAWAAARAGRNRSLRAMVHQVGDRRLGVDLAERRGSFGTHEVHAILERREQRRLGVLGADAAERTRRGGPHLGRRVLHRLERDGGVAEVADEPEHGDGDRAHVRVVVTRDARQLGDRRGPEIEQRRAAQPARHRRATRHSTSRLGGRRIAQPAKAADGRGAHLAAAIVERLEQQRHRLLARHVPERVRRRRAAPGTPRLEPFACDRQAAAVTEVRPDAIGRRAADLARVAPDRSGQREAVVRRQLRRHARAFDQLDRDRPHAALGVRGLVLAAREHHVPYRQGAQKPDRERYEERSDHDQGGHRRPRID